MMSQLIQMCKTGPIILSHSEIKVDNSKSPMKLVQDSSNKIGFEVSSSSFKIWFAT